MKSSLVICVGLCAVLGFVSSAQALGYSDAVIADNPFAYYRLNEVAVTDTVVDAMGTHHGSFINSPTVGVPGALLNEPANSAVSFNPALEQYVELTTLGDYGSMMTEGFSVEYWQRPTDSSDGRSPLGSVHIPEFVSNFFIATEGIEGSIGSIRLYFRDHNWNRYNVYSHARDRTVDIFDGSWHHMVHVYDPTGATLEERMLLYVDGVEQVLEIQTGGGVPNDFRNFNVPMVLGATNHRGNIRNHFSGELDEVAFYARQLSKDEVLNHFHASLPCTDDIDGDGYVTDLCGGKDCDDSNGDTYPSAPELCDYVDNQCSGDTGYGEIDEGCGLFLVSPVDGAIVSSALTLEWAAGEYDYFLFYCIFPYAGFGYWPMTLPWLPITSIRVSDPWWDAIEEHSPAFWGVVGYDTATGIVDGSELWSFTKELPAP